MIKPAADAPTFKKRYLVVAGSQSAHCCFDYTVVDTTKPLEIGGKHWKNHKGEYEYEAVCECFDHPEARRIEDALNRMQDALDDGK